MAVGSDDATEEGVAFSPLDRGEKELPLGQGDESQRGSMGAGELGRNDKQKTLNPYPPLLSSNRYLV
jgi:hypothetical protein